MSRLIDADLLKKSLAEWGRGGDPQETTMVKLEDILISFGDEIDKQPTAYNVEKVVVEIEEAECASGALEKKCWLDKVIDAVRKGGVE